MKNKRICILKCSILLNYGNDFINSGGEYLLKSLWGKDNFFDSVEVLDSGINNKIIYPDHIKNYLESFDYIFVMSGSLIGERSFIILEEISKLKNPKKVLLGIGCLLYNQKEKEICKKLENIYDYIICRGQETYSYFTNKNNNVFLGIDLAFFKKDTTTKIEIEDQEKYAIINIDYMKNNLDKILSEYKKLSKIYNKVYIVENTSTRYIASNFENFTILYLNYLYITDTDFLYRLFQNASYIITNRIHTIVAAISNGVLFKYVGEYDEFSIGRNCLFNNFFKLKKNTIYKYKNIEKIENKKLEMKNLLQKLFIKG